ncbi:uncharacterized protein I303_102457 [Kwoniella dejecticola CBS 10117]|uniref:Protein kinase domain-containing protein n=1 Tax=Kwoniella dejecticola CBS 10117 TaxID=1296121 RepID=A0AAJ8KLL3_9TREE
MSGSKDTGQTKQTATANRPTLLQPPATIVSPPSPTDAKDFHPPTFSFPPQPSTNDNDSTEAEDAVEYDSPEEEDEEDQRRNEDPPTPARPQNTHRPSYGSLSPGPQAAISTQLTQSPQKDGTLQLPDSPDPSASSTRPPSPSSPRYRPKGMHHRRTSSTHRVRETTHGTQTSTDDGQRMINQYKIGRRLGQGAYAKVELAVDVGTGQEYAVKEFSKSRLHYQALQEKHRQNTRGRIRRAQASSAQPTTDAANKKAGEDEIAERGNQPWGGTKTIEEDPLGLIRREVAIMKKLEAPFELPQTREYFRQLCLGLEYLHANGVIHRDVKPDNVLLSSNKELVKLCDFGVSEMFTAKGDDRIKKSGGSPAFLSPESFTAHQQDLHGKAVDIWALGVTLYCMLTGKLPFNVPTPMELFSAVREKEPNLPEHWEDSQKDLIKRMLEKDPKRRIAMTDLREHAWVTENGQEPMIDTEANLFDVGKHVEEPTQEELKDAIGTLRGIFTVIRAVQKMKRNLARNRRSGPSSPGSTNVSLASGSMDSYVSHGQNTSATSISDENDDAGYGDIAGDQVMSPRSMSRASTGNTEKQLSAKLEKLTPLDTDVGKLSDSKDRGQDDGEGNGESAGKGEEDTQEEVALFDSPVSSDDEVQKTPVKGGSD